MIQGPSGSGKTTLVTSVLKQYKDVVKVYYFDASCVSSNEIATTISGRETQQVSFLVL